MQLLKFLLRRLIQSAISVVIIITLMFLLLHATPGDIVDVLAGEAGAASAEYMASLRQQFGLDQPILVQWARYIGKILTFDLGYSFRANRPVSDIILERMPATLLLMGISIVISVSIGVCLGVISALNVNKAADGLISLVALIFYATPIFWMALMLIIVFSLHLGWFPTGGMQKLGQTISAPQRALDIAHHAALPGLALSLFYSAVYTRLMRASMLEVRGSDFVRTARAKGLGPSAVTWRHTARNALMPIVTMAGLQTGSVVGGAVLVETVFAWPGLGRLASDSILQRDFNLLLGIVVTSSLIVVAVNILVDLIYSALDPRIRIV